jgi:hypothetical protein
MAFTGSPKAKAGCMPAWMKGNMMGERGCLLWVLLCGGNRAQKPERPTVPKMRSHDVSAWVLALGACVANRIRSAGVYGRGAWSHKTQGTNKGTKQLDARSMRSAVGVLYIPEPFEHSEILHIRPSEKRCVLFVVLL